MLKSTCSSFNFSSVKYTQRKICLVNSNRANIIKSSLNGSILYVDSISLVGDSVLKQTSTQSRNFHINSACLYNDNQRKWREQDVHTQQITKEQKNTQIIPPAYHTPTSNSIQTSTSTSTPSTSSSSIEDSNELFVSPRITVFGVGGAGGNAINNLIDDNVGGVEFVVANTDAQALSRSKASRKIQLGKRITKGMGAGSKSSVGREAAKESMEDIMKEVSSTQMLFVTAGLGGGTGTGAAPIITEYAKNQGILTIAIVTTPFHFEGKKKMQSAEEGISELEKAVDTLIVIPNQRLLLAEEKSRSSPSWQESFKMVDSVLLNGVKGITDVLTIPGEINIDFADLRTIIQQGGRAILGTGESDGRGRARLAAQAALSNPLLEDVPIHGAKGCVINICSGNDLALREVDEIMGEVKKAIDEDANIILGSTIDSRMSGKVRVTLLLTGMSSQVRRPSTSQIQEKQKNEVKKNINNKVIEEKEEETSSLKNFTKDPWGTFKKWW